MKNYIFFLTICISSNVLYTADTPCFAQDQSKTLEQQLTTAVFNGNSAEVELLVKAKADVGRVYAHEAHCLIASGHNNKINKLLIDNLPKK